MLFCVGLKAPGIPKSQDYLRHNDEEAARLLESDRRSASEGSTWSGLWTKMGKLLPYMWPKKSVGLQCRVLLCLLLLTAVRVANVFVPIFYKKISLQNIFEIFVELELDEMVSTSH